MIAARVFGGLMAGKAGIVHLHGVKDIGLSGYPNVKRWHDAIEAQPAVRKAWTPFA